MKRIYIYIYIDLWFTQSDFTDLPITSRISASSILAVVDAAPSLLNCWLARAPLIVHSIAYRIVFYECVKSDQMITLHVCKTTIDSIRAVGPVLDLLVTKIHWAKRKCTVFILSCYWNVCFFHLHRVGVLQFIRYVPLCLSGLSSRNSFNDQIFEKVSGHYISTAHWPLRYHCAILKPHFQATQNRLISESCRPTTVSYLNWSMLLHSLAISSMLVHNVHCVLVQWSNPIGLAAIPRKARAIGSSKVFVLRVMRAMMNTTEYKVWQLRLFIPYKSAKKRSYQRL